MPGWGRALNFHTHLLRYLRALENVWVKCNFPARLRICRVRETQTFHFVLENSECNVIMTISHATVNPAVLNFIRVTTDLQKENRQSQSWRDERTLQAVKGTCCQAWKGGVVVWVSPESTLWKDKTNSHMLSFELRMFLMVCVYLHIHTKNET